MSTSSVDLSVDIVDVPPQSVVCVVGHLLVSHAHLVREIDPASLANQVVIDLADTYDLDVAGVAAVGALARNLIEAGHRVRVIQPTRPEPAATADMAGIFDLINQRAPLGTL